MPHVAGIWYEWHGPEDGDVLILSPGLGGSAEYWRPNLAAFAENCRVLLYDHRGTGRSDPSLPAEVSVESMADDVARLADALGIGKANFIGHALGGLIGLELARSARVHIEKLVVVNGWKQLHPHTGRCFDLRLELLRKSGPEAYVKAQPIFLYPPSWIVSHGEEIEADAARQLAHFPPNETVEKRIAAARSWELRSDIDATVLVVATEDDMLVPSECARDLKEALALTIGWTTQFGGHACNVTNVDIFNRIMLEFLEK
jgi:aminoacrylate hydrolase